MGNVYSPLLCASILMALVATDAWPESEVNGTCTGVFPSYWQDPQPKFAAMWNGQTISNVPPAGWSGPVFKLSDKYPRTPVRPTDQPWREHRFDALFDANSDQRTKTNLAREYAWAVMRYIQEGNIDGGDIAKDWTLCNNKVRRWYHIPFQTYDAMSGREFVRGLTREAPVEFNLNFYPNVSITVATTVWAVAIFNPTAAYTLGRVWQSNGTATVPTQDVEFDDGSVIGKLLFSTAPPELLPILANMPTWTANISDSSFCKCNPAHAKGQCTMIEESQQCGRSTTKWGPVRLLQFDIAIKDSRAPVTEWVYGTFVADGQRNAQEPNPWNRIAPLGLIWGNDTPPKGGFAHAYPPDPRRNGFAEEVIFWDTVDMLNATGGAVPAMWPGHLGCNSRLNGPADNANSSCISCHMTASVRDKHLSTPPIIAQFDRSITQQCVTPDTGDPNNGTDAAGSPASVKMDISFAAMDGIYMANTAAGKPFNMTVQTRGGSKNVLVDEPQYADGRKSWISLDFSLQLSISLVQWGQWQQHATAEDRANRVHSAILPAR